VAQCERAQQYGGGVLSAVQANEKTPTELQLAGAMNRTINQQEAKQS
jgi:hypothetical protein